MVSPQINIGHRRTVRRSVGDRKACALQAACWIRCRVSSERKAGTAFCCRVFYEQIVDTNGSGHGALAGFLQAVKADALICGGIGMGAQMALSDAGIRLYAGVQGSADAAAKALADGTLKYDPDATCDHHGHHHGEGHECGHHHGDEGCRRHHGE